MTTASRTGARMTVRDEAGPDVGPDPASTAPRAPGSATVTLLAGSGSGTRESFRREVARLVHHLVGQGYAVRYGGAGLAGCVADAAVRGGGRVERIVAAPPAEPDGPGVDVRVVASRAARKDLLLGDVDAVVVLPGGIETVDEFFDAYARIVRGESRTPLVVYDVEGYWHGLRKLLACFVSNGFLGTPELDAVPFVDSPGELVGRIRCGPDPGPDRSADRVATAPAGRAVA